MSTITCYLGIDPGVSGGIACLIGDEVFCTRMPKFRVDVLHWIKRCCDAGDQVVATIEKVSGYVGGVGNTGASQFVFGKSVGAIEMALVACGVHEFDEVIPYHWHDFITYQ